MQTWMNQHQFKNIKNGRVLYADFVMTFYVLLLPVDINFFLMFRSVPEWKINWTFAEMRDSSRNKSLYIWLIVHLNVLNCFVSPQLNQNVKNFSQNLNRIMLTLKDHSVITLDKMPPSLVQRTKEYLEKLKQGKSGNQICFSILIFTLKELFWAVLNLTVNSINFFF